MLEIQIKEHLSVTCCYPAFNTEMGSNRGIGTLHGNKCYGDSVTIPVMHTMSMAHGSWIRARMTENDPIALILRRKGKELNMLTLDVLNTFGQITAASRFLLLLISLRYHLTNRCQEH